MKVRADARVKLAQSSSVYIYTCAHIYIERLRTTITAISQQYCSARSSQVLHPNLLVATHRPKDLPGPLYL